MSKINSMNFNLVAHLVLQWKRRCDFSKFFYDKILRDIGVLISNIWFFQWLSLVNHTKQIMNYRTTCSVAGYTLSYNKDHITFYCILFMYCMCPLSFFILILPRHFYDTGQLLFACIHSVTSSVIYSIMLLFSTFKLNLFA